MNHDYRSNIVGSGAFNRKNLCMNQKLPAGYNGCCDITIGKPFSFTLPVNFTTNCGIIADTTTELCKNFFCDNACAVCGKACMDVPRYLDMSSPFDVSGLITTEAVASAPGPKLIPRNTYQQKLGGLACNFAYNRNVDKYCTVDCKGENKIATFHGIWRWIVTVARPTESGDPLDVDLRAYLNIRFLGGESFSLQ